MAAGVALGIAKRDRAAAQDNCQSVSSCLHDTSKERKGGKGEGKKRVGKGEEEEESRTVQRPQNAHAARVE